MRCDDFGGLVGLDGKLKGSHFGSCCFHSRKGRRNLVSMFELLALKCSFETT